MRLEDDALTHAIVIDAETDGLHGDAVAVAATLVSVETGETLGTFFACEPNPDSQALATDGFDMHRQVIEPIDSTGAVQAHDSARAMRDAFWSWLQNANSLDNCDVWADYGWPVETGLLSMCVRDGGGERDFDGPYPLHEIASVTLAASLTGWSLEDVDLPEGAEHDPRYDVAVSAARLTSALRHLRGQG